LHYGRQPQKALVAAGSGKILELHNDFVEKSIRHVERSSFNIFVMK